MPWDEGRNLVRETPLFRRSTSTSPPHRASAYPASPPRTPSRPASHPQDGRRPPAMSPAPPHPPKEDRPLKRGDISKNSASLRLSGRLILMHLETSRGLLQRHGPLRDVGWRRFSRGDMGQQPLRLCVSAGGSTSCTWRRPTAHSNGIARCVTSDGGGSPAETRRRGDMSQQPLRLCASAGGSTSCAWRRPAAHSNGIARCVTPAGGDSPAETLRRGDISKNSASLRLCGRLILMRLETFLGSFHWHRTMRDIG